MKRYTREQLIHYVKELAKKLGRTPRIRDMNKHKSYPSASTYLKRFSGWNNALRHAGLQLNFKIRYDPDELLDNLKTLSKELGKTPRAKDLKKWMASHSTYRKYFGSWKNALKQAKIKDKDFLSLRPFTKQ